MDDAETEAGVFEQDVFDGERQERGEKVALSKTEARKVGSHRFGPAVESGPGERAPAFVVDQGRAIGRVGGPLGKDIV